MELQRSTYSILMLIIVASYLLGTRGQAIAPAPASSFQPPISAPPGISIIGDPGPSTPPSFQPPLSLPAPPSFQPPSSAPPPRSPVNPPPASEPPTSAPPLPTRSNLAPGPAPPGKSVANVNSPMVWSGVLMVSAVVAALGQVHG